ncbi:MAG: hypothetical protein ACRBDL_07975 [Alphaproteobacteria bacterium]
MSDQDNTSENSEKKPKRKTWKWVVFAIIALPIAWWVFFGGGATTKMIIMHKYFGVEPPGDGTHHLWKGRDEFKEMIEQETIND